MKAFFYSVMFLCAIVSGGMKVYSDYEYEHRPMAMVDYVVEQGDTIYGIATKIATPRDNINEISYEIITANNIKQSYIYPGQVIKVPTPKE